MNKDRVKNLIRKLYRTGQGRTNEAARARERMDELARKYDLDPKRIIDHEERLYGVVGDYWREVLLASIAKSLGCQVSDQVEAKRRFAVVSGKLDDVSQLVELYRLAEVRIAVQFTSWWCRESVKLKTVPPTYSYDEWGEPMPHYNIPSQWPPPPRFTIKQVKQVRPILFRLMAVSVAETFADAGANRKTPDASTKRKPETSNRKPSTWDQVEWTVDQATLDALHEESNRGSGRRKMPPPPSRPNFHRPPPLGTPQPKDSANVLDGAVDKLISILGPDEAKALGEGAIDFGADVAVSLREIVQKPMLQLPARSGAAVFPVQRVAPKPDIKPRLRPGAEAQAQAAAHVRKVISRFKN